MSELKPDDREVVCIELKENLDRDEIKSLKKTVADRLTTETRKMQLDFSQVVFIGASAIHALSVLGPQLREKGVVPEITNLAPPMARILEKTGTLALWK